MHLLRLFIFVLALSCDVLTSSAQAQEKVSIRSGGHDGYSRLVLEWGGKPAYSLSKEGGRLLIRFSKSAAADMAEFSKDKNLQSLSVLSGASEPLQLALSIPDGSRFRDFIVENKLIVDVYDSSQAKQSVPEETQVAKDREEKPSPQPEINKPAEQTAEPSNKNTVAEKSKKDFTRKPADAAPQVPVEDVETAPVAAPAFEPHVITMTNITSFGIAAFTRHGQFFIATDNADFEGMPQITGPQKEQFGSFEKLEGVENGVVFRADLPESVAISADGGGLSWRIVFDAKAEDNRKATVAQTMVGDGASKLVWPMKNMRKIVKFTDPIVGDYVNAVTASDSAEFSGEVRNYVDLQTLNSVIGLAYVAKSDNIAAQISLTDVRIETSGGLNLSDPQEIPSAISNTTESETADAKLETEETSPEDKPQEPEEKKEDTAAEAQPDDPKHNAKEDLSLNEEPPVQDDAEHAAQGPTKDEMIKAAEEKPSGNNIYNFPRWEMGGIKALDNNVHVLMVEAANKPEETRAEDIITMAKLLLANNRGPEALGMLRIALQRVPEIEENKEFKSLRGAALALSGKYDEAFTDFTSETLSQYDDIKLWLAYTLGGLEDWKQAGDILPSYATVIQTYPDSVKTPLALMFAEISLRNGKIDLADSMLELLKPKMSELALPYASSWNYLAGESRRQHGDRQKATEYWEPLVKKGRDDLFRAKAGLSLTKMQIDQKTLKPDEAIARMEGLRYAWRGDELETLINFRLGQLYIDNKEYLKGLTVLRNATTLTPGLQVGQDVKAYMTKSFRDVFANDRLKNVSPLDAIGIYEEFKDLTPPGDEGNAYVEKLAERLVEADLLGRAASLLEFQVNNRLKGDKKAEVAIRLAAIRLLDGNPDGALRSLEVAQDALDKIEKGLDDTPAVATPKPEEITPQAGETTKAASPVTTPDPEKQRQIYLLKARALSMKKKPEEAIAILDLMVPDPDVSRLRTDIAWVAGKWEEAAMSLNDLIVAEDVSPKRPLTEYQRDLILNRSIALNLSGNRVALANLRERYNAQMKDTTKGQMFEVVTRPRRPDMIGSREAIESMISEIDLFKGFLEGYGKLDDAKKAGAKEPAAPKEPVPAGEKGLDEKETAALPDKKEAVPETKEPAAKSE